MKSEEGSPALPAVAVLLATYNGERYVEEQVCSIVDQTGVIVKLFVFDDQSKDDTVFRLEVLAQQHANIVIVRNPVPSGSAFANFYNAISGVDVNSFDYVALADQDDIWTKDKLARQITSMSLSGASASSASVVAFDASGKEAYINNAGVQSAIDFAFTGGGQGCTYLIHKHLFQLLQSQIENLRPKGVPHDWLIYALSRYQGYQWIILTEPLLRYRQHQNVFGSRTGLRGKLFRLRMLISGKFKEDRQRVIEYLSDGSLSLPERPAVQALKEADKHLTKRVLFAAGNLFAFRRFRVQSVLMALFFLFGWA